MESLFHKITIKMEEKINIKKRNLLKKTAIILGIASLFSVSPVTAIENLPSNKETKETIIKDGRGRIIKIINENGGFEFNVNDPLEYKKVN